MYLLTNNGEGSFADIYVFDFTLDTPEPATFSMIGAGLAGLGLMAFRRKP